jgi:hypothetical protein
MAKFFWRRTFYFFAALVKTAGAENTAAQSKNKMTARRFIAKL